MPAVVESIAGLRARLHTVTSNAAAEGRPRPRIALVPTMGALHEGHLALVERAGETAEIVVVSIFVNPLQFGRGEDLDRYPRGVESDLELLSELGVQFVFAPAVTEMYPSGAVQMTVTAGNAGLLFEGHSRPGHFDGVLTVVAKLLNIVHPDTVVFGEKDAQQVFLVKQMIADLDFEVAVETVITVREPDGLALSSRNRFLDAEERLAADALPRALEAAKSSANRGPDAALAAAQSVLVSDSRAQLDYLAIVDPITFLPVGADHRGPATMLAAARFGTTRLIDNAALQLG